jgi:hypothetical protein
MNHGRWDVEDVQAFGRAIRGHPTITSFDSNRHFPYKCMDLLFSALVTVPSLKSIDISHRYLYGRIDDESTLANPESLTELLRLPTLRSVVFYSFIFTPTLCRALANALMEGMVVTKLEFEGCSFSAPECVGMMANGLSGNASVSQMHQCHTSKSRFRLTKRFLAL